MDGAPAGVTLNMRPPFLVFVGDESCPVHAKTGFGIVQWRPERVAGQLRLDACGVDLKVPDLDIETAFASGVKSLLIGVSPVGGRIPDAWWRSIIAAAEAGLDIISGLHIRLADHRELAAVARKSGVALVDVRVPPPDLPVGTGRKRSGKRLLTVGTDCAVGKKYTALALHAAMQAAGMATTFRATGQTGIMIAGSGVPLDAVASDFIAGAAEILSPDNAPDHWDVIEGQGSIFHPGYAGVSLGLLHGSQADAFVVCHDASRTAIAGWPDYAVPKISECIRLHEILGRRTNAGIQCVGISVNTAGLSRDAGINYRAKIAEELRLPCVDPLIDGCDSIINLVMTERRQ